MRWTHVLVAFGILIGRAETPTAQTLSIDDITAARAGIRLGYGGRGIDGEVSIDSPLLAGIGRFRADVGFGRWVGLGEVPPPAGGSPWVTRLDATAILFLPSVNAPDLRSYIGLGVSAYVPSGAGLDRQRGTRVIFGLESSGDRWDAGPEVEFDLPKARPERRAGFSLIPSVRIGIAIRRRF